MNDQARFRRRPPAPSCMDDDTLRAAYAAHSEGQPKFTRRMAILIADMAEMKPMSLVWRLEKLGLLKSGSWEWFKRNGGITADNIREVRADLEADRRASNQEEHHHE